MLNDKKKSIAVIFILLFLFFLTLLGSSTPRPLDFKRTMTFDELRAVVEKSDYNRITTFERKGNDFYVTFFPSKKGQEPKETVKAIPTIQGNLITGIYAFTQAGNNMEYHFNPPLEVIK